MHFISCHHYTGKLLLATWLLCREPSEVRMLSIEKAQNYTRVTNSCTRVIRNRTRASRHSTRVSKVADVLTGKYYDGENCI